MKKRRAPKQKAQLTPTMQIATDVLRGQEADILTVDEVQRMYGPCRTRGYHNNEVVRTAQDAALASSGVYSLLQHTICSGLIGTMPQFVGYGVLSNLTQDGLIRSGIEMRADEMTRKWIELTHSGQDKEAEQERDDGALSSSLDFPLPANTSGDSSEDTLVSTLNSEIDRFKLRRLFREAAAMCGYFGGCLAYIDVGDVSDDDLKLPLKLDEFTFAKDSLRGFRLIEPFNIAPGLYNSDQPLSESYFKPATWYVLGREVHASRFLYFSEGKPPTLLLPAYNFFGVPLAQIVLDVVTHFTECREAEARLLTKFSLTVMKTNMQVLLTGGSDGNIRRRIEYFVQNRDNDGIMTIDKDTEDIIKLETPLSGVTDIVRQAMEMVAAMFGEPVVKLWGISPGGFNSTGESDMQNHYDHVNSVQEKIFREPLDYALRVLQMNKYGVIDDSLTFSFSPLGDDDDRAIADIQKIKADTAAVLFDRGIVDGEEVRKTLAEDPKSAFTNIDPGKEIAEPDLALPLEEEPQGTSPQDVNEGEPVRVENRDLSGNIY